MLHVVNCGRVLATSWCAALKDKQQLVRQALQARVEATLEAEVKDPNYERLNTSKHYITC